MSSMIFKRRFMAMASNKIHHDEQEIDQVSNFRKILMDMGKHA